MYLRSAGIWDICFCFFGIFFLLLLGKVIGDKLEKICKGNEKIAIIICIALATVISYLLTSVVAIPLANVIERITGLEDLL